MRGLMNKEARMYQLENPALDFDEYEAEQERMKRRRAREAAAWDMAEQKGDEMRDESVADR
jgi:hypothetical protein